MPVRAVAVIDGQVQGVGFRYFTRRVAKRTGVTGLVRNLEDGRVEIVCEGEREKVEEFIEGIKVKRPPIEVESVEVRYGEPTDEFKTFKVVTEDLAEETVEGFSTWASLFEVFFQKQEQRLQKQG